MLTLLSAPTTTPLSYCTATMVVPVWGASAAAPDLTIAAPTALPSGYKHQGIAALGRRS